MIKGKRLNEYVDGICPLCKQTWEGMEYREKKGKEPGIIKKRDVKKMIGERVKAFRIERQYSQLKLSKLLGTGRTYISHIENGRINISFEYLYKIADVLKCSIHDFFEN